MALSDSLLNWELPDLLAHTNRRFWRKLARDYSMGNVIRINGDLPDEVIVDGLTGQFCALVLAEEALDWKWWEFLVLIVLCLLAAALCVAGLWLTDAPILTGQYPQ